MLTIVQKQHPTSYAKVLNHLLGVRARSATTVEQSRPDNHYDIIIAGGGLVGTTLAAALTTNRTLSEKRVLLLEGAPAFKGFDGQGEYRNRVSAINKRSSELFQTIGVWDMMTAARMKSVKQMQVWDASSDALIQFQHDHFANDVAFIIENDLILNAIYTLLNNLGPLSNVDVRNKALIEKVRLPKSTGTAHSEVSLKDGESFSCELLIGADGVNSLVRKEMGVDVYSLDYKSMGLVATLEMNEAGDNAVAWQRFIPSGPVALLPLDETKSSLVWSTSVPHAKKLLNMPATEFVDELNKAFFNEYPKDDIVVKAVNGLNTLMSNSPIQLRQYPPQVSGVLENSRAVFPLGLLHASSYVCSGAALIGDAAHRVHPLAGQGVNLGFSDIKYLVKILADAVYSGAKIGDLRYLIKYENSCLKNNVPIIVGIHGLQTLYSTTFSPVVLLRSLGLQLTQNLPFIKNEFMKRAIG